MHTATAPLGIILRRSFSAHPSGVVAVCGLDERDAPVGMIASTFIPVSLDPPLVSISAQKTSTTWPRLRSSARIGISVLGADQEHHARALSGRPSPDRFADVPFDISPGGAVFITAAIAAFECSLLKEVEAGDHLIAVLDLHDAKHEEVGEPLVFHRSTYTRLPTP